MRNRPIYIATLSLAAALALGACATGAQPVEKTIYVGPLLVDCVGVGPQQCLQVKENPEDEYTLFYDQIEGFEFEPGYEYELRVAEETIANPPADASSMKWRLIEVVSKTPVSSPLDGTQWTLEGYRSAAGELADVLPGTQVTLEFADGKLSGNAGCNSYFSDYQADAQRLSTGVIASTEMFCTAPEGIMDQEIAYLAALGSAASYLIDGEQLVVMDSNGETVLTFSVLQPPSLTGETWEMIFYNNGKGGVVSALLGSTVTAVFGEDSSLSGSAGCNNYHSSYVVDGDGITITAPAATRMFCAEPEGIMEQENAYLMALESVASYRFQQGNLELYNADGALAIRFKVSQPSLSGTSWTLTDLSPSEEAVSTLIAGTQITATFGEDGILSGSAGCNQYSAEYETDGNMLKVGLAISTNMFCGEPEGLMDQESFFLSNLEIAASYQISGEVLQILDENGRMLLSFHESSPDLEGTTWVWSQFQSSADEVISPDNPEKYTLSFKSGGVLEIQADCAFVTWKFRTEGGSLIIEPGDPSPALCSPGSLSDRFLQLVGDSTTYLFTDSGELAISILYDSGILFFTPGK